MKVTVQRQQDVHGTITGRVGANGPDPLPFQGNIGAKVTTKGTTECKGDHDIVRGRQVTVWTMA